jgi:hypothetical protein
VLLPVDLHPAAAERRPLRDKAIISTLTNAYDLPSQTEHARTRHGIRGGALDFGSLRIW